MNKAAFFLFIFLWGQPVFAEVDPLKKVAAELADGLSVYKDKKIAILAVPHHDSRISDGPSLVSEKIATYLVKDKRLSLIERSHIVQILGELHLSETGILDPKTTKRMGQALGADILITGTLIDLKDKKTEVNVRGLLAENGRVLSASRTVIDRTWSRLAVGW